MQKGSKNRSKQRIKVANLHEKVANQRKDFLHKQSRQIANAYDCVCIENLDMKAMSQSLNFGKSVADDGWGMFVTFLKYKREETGKRLVKVNKFFASSQICNVCGYKNTATKNLSIRAWDCPDIFNLENRDVIIISPQQVQSDKQKGFHDGNNSVYMTGIFDKEKFTFTKDVRTENNFYAAELDYGIDFYAPQTMQSPDGRRIMIAWLQAWESYLTPKNFSWSGMMTLPRELFFKDDCLYQRPVFLVH